jgi:DNA-binding NtrC family response regulator
LLRRQGYEVATAENAFRGLELVGKLRPAVVLTDLRMPGLDGLVFLDSVRAAAPGTRVVVMSAYASVDVAVEAMKRGADDFVEKPIDVEALCRTLEVAMERAALLGEAQAQPACGASAAAALGIVGEHPAMRAVLQRAEQVAQSRSTVLLTGESGTGKNLLAETIHRMSGRAQGPFVELSCASLTESLLESELFGHERGAFTGAVSRREGRFMQAAAGTLYLDEIGLAPPAMQVKLLRFLQTRQFERVGGNQTLTVDARLIAAANIDLRAEVAAGRFRQDLFYRLNVFRVHLPPLRLRRSDIPALAETFLVRFAAENERPLGGFSREALEKLVLHHWPGNVRELEHAVEHAAIMSRGSLVMPHDLPESIGRPPHDSLEVTIPGSTLAEIERAAILKSVMSVGGKATEAAAMLGISKSKIYYRLRDYGSESSRPDGGAMDATRSSDSPAPVLRSGQRQVDGDGRPLPGPARDPDLAAVVGDDAVGHAEAEPEAAFVRAGGVEGSEEAAETLPVDPAPVVADLDANGAVAAHRAQNDAGAKARLDRVAQDVDQSLLEGDRVAPDRGRLPVEL